MKVKRWINKKRLNVTGRKRKERKSGDKGEKRKT